ncbi:conserved hypothetical protein, partial [Ixodes scapularis]
SCLGCNPVPVSMSTMKLSPHDRKELDKFIRFLAFKSVQVIVQSRLGEKQKTKSKPFSTVSDWFNLDIPDIPEITEEVRRALGSQIPEAGGPSLCTEISLQTVEGDSLVLETWQLSGSEACDASVRVIYTVYNRMSLLLKSLVAVTRVTPAYKLSLRQGPDSYVVCYRVYMGEPQQLGEGSQKVQVGQVGTPTGTLSLRVHYRTKLAISPQRAMSQGNPMMLKSDYFKPDLSPKGLRALARRGDKDSSASGEAAKRQCTTAGHNGCSNGLVPFCALASFPRSASRNMTGRFKFQAMPKKASLETNDLLQVVCRGLSQQETQPPYWEAKTRHLTHQNSGTDCVSRFQHGGFAFSEARSTSLGDSPSQRSAGKRLVSNSLKVYVAIKPPFAEDGDPGSDLGAFFQECQSAPMLQSYSYEPTLEEQVNEINATLAALEASLPELDEFVESICRSDSLK